MIEIIPLQKKERWRTRERTLRILQSVPNSEEVAALTPGAGDDEARTRDKFEGAVAAAITSPLEDRLKTWAEGDAYQLTTITRDIEGTITTATVLWPDGSAGVFTTTIKNSVWLTIDAYTITHLKSGKSVVQSAVTRDTNGAVVTKPALTITNP